MTSKKYSKPIDQSQFMQISRPPNLALNRCKNSRIKGLSGPEKKGIAPKNNGVLVVSLTERASRSFRPEPKGSRCPCRGLTLSARPGTLVTGADRARLILRRKGESSGVGFFPPIYSHGRTSNAFALGPQSKLYFGKVKMGKPLETSEKQ